jgi:hypothetical protein
MFPSIVHQPGAWSDTDSCLVISGICLPRGNFGHAENLRRMHSVNFNVILDMVYLQSLVVHLE